MQSNRKVAIAKNMSVTILYQIISITIGFMIPKLLLQTYGASIHGLTSTLTNLMNYVLLLNAGLTTASIQSLYEPIGIKDIHRISEVYNAIKKHYRNTGVLYIIAVFLIAFILPIIIGNEIDSFTVFWLMIVMGLVNILDCYLIAGYRALLQADQKLYIINIINMISFVLRGLFQIILIIHRAPIIVIQGIPVILVLFNYILFKKYVSKHYSFINLHIKEDMNALSKRWYAFIHQLSGLVVNNTPTIILTIFSNQVTVSIYSIYNLVFSHLYSLVVNVFSSGSVASFGDLYAKENIKIVRNKFTTYEYLYYIVISIIYSVCSVLILPFVGLYTSGVNINYINVRIALLFILSGLLNNIRVPALTIIDVAGLYKETQSRAIIEMAINLTTSIILVGFFKLYAIYAILIGNILAFLYRSFDMILYANRNIFKSKSKLSIYRVLRIFICVLINMAISKIIVFSINSWASWVFYAIVTFIYSSFFTLLINYFFDKKSFKDIIYMIKDIIKVL